jgi:hypothetical protein
MPLEHVMFYRGFFVGLAIGGLLVWLWSESRTLFRALRAWREARKVVRVLRTETRQVVVRFIQGSYRPPRIVDNPEE